MGGKGLTHHDMGPVKVTQPFVFTYVTRHAERGAAVLGLCRA